MLSMDFEIHFPRMPLWKGVLDKPSRPEFFPYSLGWDERGFLRQTTPSDIQKRVMEYYAMDEYRFPSTPPGGSSWGDTRGDLAVEFIREVCGSLRGKTVLDIGGGTTYMGNRLVHEDDVREYTLMDPSVRETGTDPRIKIAREYFTAENHPFQGYDLVISMNCLEHVGDPVNFLCGVRSVMESSDDGKAVLIFPDNEIQLQKGDFNFILHEHISYFTREIIENLFGLCGLRVIRCKSCNDLFYCYLEPGEKLESVEKIDRNIIKAADAFVENLEYFKTLVERLTDPQLKVAFHGACNGLNNVLAFSDFQNHPSYERSWIFDGDEKKQGKYLPMCPNPILHSKAAMYRDVDHVIISAMTFYEPIKTFLISHHGFEPERIHPIYPH